MAVGSSQGGAGFPLVERWNGTSWAIQSIPIPEPAIAGGFGAGLEAVSCTSATICTAVGGYESGGFENVPLAERWNGIRWVLQRTQNANPELPFLGSSLDAVSCGSPTACMAVGYGGQSNTTGPSLAEQWNGQTWSIVSTPNPHTTGNGLIGVSCPSAKQCTAVGLYDAAEHAVALVERWSDER